MPHLGLLLLLLSLAAPMPALADPSGRLLQLASIPGTAGHEAAVREAIVADIRATQELLRDLCRGG